MAWSKVGERTFLVTTGAGTESISLPGSPATGDVVLAILATDQGLAGDGTTGSGGIASSSSYMPIASGNLLPSYQVAYKVMGGTPDATVDIDRSADVSRPIAGIIQIWRGADSTTTIDATPSINSGTSGLPNPPSHTTVTNGALRIIVGLLDDDTALTTAAPSGYTNFLSATTTGSTGNFGATVMVASKEEATAGADDPGAFTGGVGSDDWFGLHFAFRPASGDGGTSYTLSAEAGSVSLAGQAAAIRRGYRIPAEAGAVTALGAGASLVRGRRIDAAAGALAVTGQDAALSRAARLSAGAGSVEIAGAHAALLRGYRVAADAATFTIAGSPASLRRGRMLAAGAGTIAVDGGAAGLLAGRRLGADAGTLAIEGGTAALRRGYRLAAQAGSLTVTGFDAGLDLGVARRLEAGTGAFTVTGGAAALLRGHRLAASAGAVAVSGSDAGLRRASRLTAGAGSVAIGAGEAGLRRGYRVSVEVATFTLGGETAALRRGYRLAAAGGAIEIIGLDATLSAPSGIDWAEVLSRVKVVRAVCRRPAPLVALATMPTTRATARSPHLTSIARAS